MSGRPPRLAFISPVFLFPNDAGGKIRTTNLLRGLRGGAFEVTLIGPATPEQEQRWAADLRTVCDRFVPWRPLAARPRWRRAFDLLRELPVNVAADRSAPALETVQRTLAAGGFDVAVFDFVHAAVLRPASLGAASVCFTHNVEAEIFQRHAAQARSPLMRAIWSSQHDKMRRYEQTELRRFDKVVAVSARDGAHFRERYGVSNPAVIPTGVDLDFFAWQLPPADTAPKVVFTGSMDWAANVDGVQFFLDEVWPRVLAELPQARFSVVGRHPPAALVEKARATPSVTFTGFVDDVRPHVHDAHAFVIPLRVGGGTRIKAFEAMAMGCPAVSTALGMEGLDVTPGRHFLLGDDPASLAASLLSVLRDAALRERLSRAARECVERHFGHQVAARVFEQACLEAWHATRAAPAAGLSASVA